MLWVIALGLIAVALWAAAAYAIGYAVAGLLWLACGRPKPRR